MTPEQLKTLKEFVEDKQATIERFDVTNEVAYRAAERLEREIKDITAAIKTIEKLPVDAEGNTVVLGGRQDVWIVVTEEGSSHFADPDQWVDPGIYKYEAVRNDQGMWCLWSDGAIDCDYWDGPVYSTREAAEAAAKEGEALRKQVIGWNGKPTPAPEGPDDMVTVWQISPEPHELAGEYDTYVAKCYPTARDCMTSKLEALVDGASREQLRDGVSIKVKLVDMPAEDIPE